jgi:hypothetical protein
MSTEKKRPRLEIETELIQVKETKHHAQKRARVLKKELAVLDMAESKARSITVSWNAFCEKGADSKTAWQKVTSRSELFAHKETGCMGEDGCFYSNYSRSDGAEALYKLRIVGVLRWRDSVYVCDRCYRQRAELLTEDRDLTQITIDPNDFEPERVAAMLDYKEDDESDEGSENESV